MQICLTIVFGNGSRTATSLSGGVESDPGAGGAPEGRATLTGIGKPVKGFGVEE